jgi:nicotinamidase/pyrazinamidase
VKALLIVDIQNDFLPGGALAVKEGDLVIPLINKLMKGNFDLIIASKDWHPEKHGSFAATHGKKSGEYIELKGLEQILWPEHCIQGTLGAEFANNLDTENFKKIFYKGTDVDIDSYSAFYDNGHLKSTGLGKYLKKHGVDQLYIAGLTTEYCIKYSVLDARNLGFETYVIIDACKPVNLNKGDEAAAIEEIKRAGAKILTSKELIA